MKKKQIAPRIHEGLHEFYSSIGDNPTDGAGYVLEAFPMLHRKIMHGMKGRFSQTELMLLCDTGNGLLLTPALVGHELLASVEDGITLDALDKKWSLDGNVLLSKLRSLTHAENICLALWVRQYWYLVSGGGDSEAHVAALA